MSSTSGETSGRAMRVVHLVPTMFGAERGIVGGAERYAFELARFMARRVSTTLVSFGERDEQWDVDGLTVRVLGNTRYVRGQRSNPFSFALPGALSGADVVHVHQQHIVASSVTAVLARLRRQKVFVSDLGGGGWDVSGYVSTDRWYHGHLHISEYSRQVFGHVSNPRAHVIYGGVDTDKFSPDASVPRTPTVLFVGRLLAHKGIDVLVDAIDEGLSLEVIGRPYDGDYLELLQERAQGKNVTFRHDVSDPDLVAAYRQAAAIVLPSVYRDVYGHSMTVPELLGQTLLEGMACGTPAVCADVASMPEVVTDGVTGFVVPPNDPIALRERLHTLVEDAELNLVMGRAARADVLERFTWPRVVDRCLDIYEQQVRGRR
ncbi:MAG: glycosyltransferase family 4 protein [Blastocatellia bacterium]|nr:glycosyltransferase family 4 protein [Blastocatellia bacterium]